MRDEIRARAGVTTEEEFLRRNIFLSDRKDGEYRWTLQIKRGLLDPKEPCTAEEIQSIKKHGGLFFRRGCALLSLGARSGFEGKILCARDGIVYLENFNESGSEDTAFHTISCRLAHLKRSCYGVNRRKGYDESEPDLEMTRQIFGLDLESLEKAIAVFYRNFNFQFKPDEWHGFSSSTLYRVTCSNKDNSCDITGNLIPAEFPFIALEATQYWLGHISLDAFFKTLRFVTFGYRSSSNGTQQLTANGLTPELIQMLECAYTRHGFNSHVTWREINRF